MAELLGLDTGLLHEGEPVVGEGGVLFEEDDVAAVLDFLCTATGDDGGNVFKFVAAAKVGAVTGDAVVKETAAIGVLGFLEAIDEVGEEAGAFFVALAGGHDAGLGESVVAEGMGFERHAHAGEEGADGLAVADDICHAGLEGDNHHVIHKVDCFLAGDAFGGSHKGSVGLGDVGPPGLALEAFFNLADAGEVFIQLFLIALAEGPLHSSPVDADEVENALLFLEAGVQFLAGVAGVGEELVKEIERLVDSGDGVAGFVPREGEAFTVAGVRSAINFIGGEDEGGKTGLFPKVLSRDLIARDGIVKTLSRGACDIRSGEIGGGAAVGVGRAKVGEIGHHGDVVLMPGERAESLGHTDLGKATGLLGIKRVFGKSKAPA